MGVTAINHARGGYPCADANAKSNAYSNKYAHADEHLHPYAYRNANVYSNTYTDADKNLHTHSDSNADKYAYLYGCPTYKQSPPGDGCAGCCVDAADLAEGLAGNRLDARSGRCSLKERAGRFQKSKT